MPPKTYTSGNRVETLAPDVIRLAPERQWQWVDRSIAGRPLRIAVQAPELGFRHAVTPDDLAWILGFVPMGDLAGLEVVALAQGGGRTNGTRLRFHGDFEGYVGASIVVDTVPVGAKRVHEDADPEAELHVEPLGERVRVDRLAGVLDEIGRYVDVRQHMDHGLDASWDERWDRYWGRPVSARQQAAHRYGEGLRQALRNAGMVPFAPRFDAKEMRAEELHPAWFGPFQANLQGATPDHLPVKA